MYESPSGDKRQKHIIEKDMYDHHSRVLEAKSQLDNTEPSPHVDHKLIKQSCPHGNFAYM